MSKENRTQMLQDTLFPSFGDGFLADHAKTIIRDPHIAVVELVANAWDAGADEVVISWFEDDGNVFEIKDNGIGMTATEFRRRWLELNYDRRKDLGNNVSFPAGNQASTRRAFGKNGKGRHAMFYFAAEYYVQTYKNGEMNQFLVSRAQGSSAVPFQVSLQHTETVDKKSHGTHIWANRCNRPFDVEVLREYLGSRFISDPTFKIIVNGKEVQLTDLSSRMERREIKIDGIGIVPVILIDTEVASRTTRHHGVAWWVNKRLVGKVDWRRLNGEPFADGRTSEAKRFTFVVEADILEGEVLDEWSGFRKDSNLVRQVATPVERYISERLGELLRDARRERKKYALEINRFVLSRLSPGARSNVGDFTDGVLRRLPAIREEQLADVVAVFASLEQSRSGYALLSQLAVLSSDDLDILSDILRKWTVQQARIVLDLLHERLHLIEKLESLVDVSTSNELHQLQPLFERGLWIFGPEYESIEFTSNRTLLTVLRKLIGDDEVVPVHQQRRPDFVALADRSLGIYSQDGFGDDGEVHGIGKVLIVELKKGGFNLTRKEIQQADDYIVEIRRSGKVTDSTKITAYVLGSTLAEDARMRRQTKTGPNDKDVINAETYGTIISRAHARLFNLSRKLQEVADDKSSDSEVEEIVERVWLEPELNLRY